VCFDSVRELLLRIYIFGIYRKGREKGRERERGGDVIIYEGELPLSYLIERLAFLYSIINRIYIYV
jgi:hypothetical protein